MICNECQKKAELLTKLNNLKVLSDSPQSFSTSFLFSLQFDYYILLAGSGALAPNSGDDLAPV